MILDKFLLNFLKYEIPIVTTAVATLGVTSGGAALFSWPAFFASSSAAFLKAVQDSLKESVTLKEDQIKKIKGPS